MHILITGGAGFIGSHLAELHLGRGDSVTALDDLSTGSSGNLASFPPERCTLIEGDLLTSEVLEREIGRADRIYHMAAVVGMLRVLDQPVEVTRVNVLGTERLLRIVAESGCRPEILIASSSSVYGHTPQPILREEMELVFSPESGGLTPYALSKLTNEMQAMAYFSKYGMPVSIPRLFNAVGPRQSGNYGFVLPRFIKQALSGIPLTVYGDGSQTRSFCDVRDTVAALEMLSRTPDASGIPVNVGNPREITILDLAKLVIALSGSSSPIDFIPFEKGYGRSFSNITQRRPDIGKLHRLTSFRHSWTLERTIEDLIQRNRSRIVPEGRLL